MTAVRLELGYLTNPEDAMRLVSPQVRAQAVEAITVAVQRLYLPPEEATALGNFGCAFEFDLYTAIYPVPDRPHGGGVGGI